MVREVKISNIKKDQVDSYTCNLQIQFTDYVVCFDVGQ